MCGKNDGESCGWPAGTIRALLAVIVIVGVLIGSLVLMFFMFFSNQYAYALGILSGLTGFTGTVLGYYFGSKSAEKANGEIIKAHEREMVSKDIHIENLSRNVDVNQQLLSRNIDHILTANMV
jgi:hypothetical protein